MILRKASSGEHKAAARPTAAARSLVPPAVLLCVALLIFFSSLRKAHEDPPDEITLAVNEELADERAGLALDIQGLPHPGEEATVSAEVIQSEVQGLEIESGPQVNANNLVIAGVGDVLMLKSLVDESRRVGNFSHLWKPAERLWKQHSHLTFANLEGTMGPVDRSGVLLDKVKDYDKVYTTSISLGGFNYHESLAKDLVDSGINVLTTANNHMFDRGMQGIYTTAKTLVDAGAVQVGSTLNPAEPNRPYAEGWYRITKVNGWRIAWVGCTTLLCSTCRKDLSVPKDAIERRILFCDRAPLLVYRLSRRKDVDLVVVGAHWGNQFSDQYLSRTQDLAHQILNAGAAVIFGNHPHVMQGAEHFKTKDGRNTYVVYSIGSLTSGLGSAKMWKTRASAVVLVEFEKAHADRKYKKQTGQVVSVRVVPICEVRYGKPVKQRAVMATAHAQGKCSQEDNWVRFLVKDVVPPEGLPRVNRVPVEIINDASWKGTRLAPTSKDLGASSSSSSAEKDSAQSAAEPDESALVVADAEKWKAAAVSSSDIAARP